MDAVLSMGKGLTLPIYLVYFVAPALLWLALLPVYRSARVQHWRQRLDPVESLAFTSMVRLASLVLLLRVVVGALDWQQLSDLWAVGVFYPIRAASPNYGAVAGLPWFVVLMGVVWYWPQIDAWLDRVHYRFAALWLVAAVVLLAFAAIQGGLRAGVAGIYISEHHLSDMQYVTWTVDFFHQHLQRLNGTLMPAYDASHSSTHPPLSLQLFSLVGQVGSFRMGLLTLALFALAFPLLDLLQTTKGDRRGSAGVTALLLVTPGFLVYGNSDDAFYYLLWACALVLGCKGIRQKSVYWSLAAAVVISLSCNLTYASLVLVPGVMAFAARGSLGELPRFLREHVVSLATIAVTVVLVLVVEAMATGFNVVDGMSLVMRNQQPYLFRTLLFEDPIRGISDRVMTILDFVFFAGPVMLTTWVLALRHRQRSFMQWSIPGAAFAVLVTYIALTTPGAGESGRGWGGLYLFWWVGCGMELVRQWNRATVDNLVRFALGYAALVQLVVNFLW